MVLCFKMGFRNFVCILTVNVFFVVCFDLFSFSEGIQVTPEPVEVLEFPARYHDYHQAESLLAELAANYSDFASVYSIGQSVEHRELWVLRIKAPNSPILGAPNIKFVGNIHGNEPVGRELILRFAEYLLKNYEEDSEVKWIMNRAVFHLLPSLNPDGFERSKEGVCYSGPGRENGNSVDLNRSFPDHLKENRVSVQPETLAVARWMSHVPFLLSASFHGGALVANYPFDSSSGNGTEALIEEILKNISRGENLMDIWRNLTPDGSNRAFEPTVRFCTASNNRLTACFPGIVCSMPALPERESLTPNSSLTPDDDVFRHLARTYSDNHLTMHKGRTCNQNQPSFPGGITNGAAWYSFTGGMQDYNYVSQGCMELTLEISCCKYPQAFNLPRLWTENRKAMLELSKQSQLGVRGMIVDKITSAYVPGAVLRISGRQIPFTSSINGEFWRILLPGQYTLIVEAKGYETQNFPFTVRHLNSTHPEPTWLNIYLQPADDMLASASSNMEQMIANSAVTKSFSVFVFLPILLAFFKSWDMT